MTHEEICVWEIEWIVKENTFSINHSHDDPNDIGCNFTRGGEGTIGHKPNITDKMRQATGDRFRGKIPWNKGKIGVSEETSRKLSYHSSHRSEATRQKLSVAHKGKPTWNKGKKGVYSEETRRKISEAATRTLKGRLVTEETRRKMSESAKLREARRRALREPTYSCEDHDPPASELHSK